MQEVIITVIASGAVFGFLQFIIQFYATRSDMKKNVGKRLDDLEKKIDCNKAELCRTHILRFSDEIRNHGAKYHSEEAYKQQLLDIDTYNKYCNDNPDFSNGLTVIASDYIKSEFVKLYSGGKDNET